MEEEKDRIKGEKSNLQKRIEGMQSWIDQLEFD
jgi:hypothetical protein